MCLCASPSICSLAHPPSCLSWVTHWNSNAEVSHTLCNQRQRYSIHSSQQNREYMFLKAWSWRSGRGCTCWCASLPWSTACTTPWSTFSHILVHSSFRIFFGLALAQRRRVSESNLISTNGSSDNHPSFFLQWDESWCQRCSKHSFITFHEILLLTGPSDQKSNKSSTRIRIIFTLNRRQLDNHDPSSSFLSHSTEPPTSQTLPCWDWRQQG